MLVILIRVVYSLVGRPCGSEEWTCKSHNGECIPLSWVCDDHEDCDDKSDEKDCSKYRVIPKPNS